jgi:hypothetical protein
MIIGSEICTHRLSLSFVYYNEIIRNKVVGPAGPTTNTARLSPRYEGKNRGCYCSCWATDDGRGNARNMLSCKLISSNKLKKFLHLILLLIPTWYTNFYKLHKFKFLYMFRAPSAHPQEVNGVNCICMQPLVSSSIQFTPLTSWEWADGARNM